MEQKRKIRQSNKKKKITFKHLRDRFPTMMQKKLLVLYCIVLTAFFGLLLVVTVINAKSGEGYTKLVLDQQQYNNRVIPFRRGDILDRNGTKIATSERIYNIILDGHALNADEAMKNLAKKTLKKCFDISGDEVEDILKERGDSRYIILKKGIDYNTYSKFKQYKKAYEEKHKKTKDKKIKKRIQGIYMEEDYVRRYPYNSLGCHVIGFTSSGNIGNGGVEAYYNDVLNGTDGREYGYRSSDTYLKKEIKEPQNGDTLVTTIDVNLQSMIEKIVKDFNEETEKYDENGRRVELGSKHTSVLIMNPNNGEILAEVSYPFYDLNHPQDLKQFYSDAAIEAMENEEDEKTHVKKNIIAMQEIWKNFCVSDTFEPGSTAKPFTVAAGLESGTITPDSTFTCGGALNVAGQRIRCHYHAGHGHENLEQALANSCNVAMMEMVGKIGKDNFTRYQKHFGFGEYTGVDLPAESSGILYDPAKMGPVDLATNSFGQNFNVTMVQLAAGYCSLINGGNYYEPHVVKQIQDEEGNVVENKNAVLLKKTVSTKTSELIRQYTKAVVEYGTGKNLKLDGYSVGGKTGTAEKYPRGEGKYLLSFIGGAPAEKPEVVFYVVVDEVNASDQVNGRHLMGLTKKIMEEIFPYLNITKSKETPPKDPEEAKKEALESIDFSEDVTTGTEIDEKKQAPQPKPKKLDRPSLHG